MILWTEPTKPKSPITRTPVGSRPVGLPEKIRSLLAQQTKVGLSASRACPAFRVLFESRKLRSNFGRVAQQPLLFAELRPFRGAPPDGDRRWKGTISDDASAARSKKRVEYLQIRLKKSTPDHKAPALSKTARGSRAFSLRSCATARRPRRCRRAGAGRCGRPGRCRAPAASGPYSP